MSGIGLILTIAKDALATQRYGMEVTAHNIANVNTPGYSKQTPVLEAREPAPYGGLILGRGVDIDQVIRSTDQFIENRLMQEKSSMLSSTEMVSYMQVLEGLFNETSETSISAMLAEFWNLWHGISNNPSGASERIALYEHSILLSGQFNTLDDDLRQIKTDLTNAMSAGIDKINQITSEIAQVNDQIVGMETNNTANDLRDTRNTLVSELSEYIEVKSFEQSNGSLTVISVKGTVLVQERSSYDLVLGGDSGDRVKWQGSGTATVDITDYITKGKLGGWLTIRDEVIAKYKLDLDAIVKEFIWAVNQQHSQGVGLKLFSTEVTGTYKTDSSGLLSTLAYGNKIDYTKDFKMWIEDSKVTPASFSAVTVDMGISTAAVSNWAGIAPGATQYKYIFTVTTGGTVGTDVNVTEANGAELNKASTPAATLAAAGNGIAAQTITITDQNGTNQTVNVTNGESVASIASSLSDLNGVTAYASKTTATLGGITNAVGTYDEHDTISFSLNGTVITSQVGTNSATTRNNLESAISNAGLTDLTVTNNADGTFTIVSASGANVSIENYKVHDNTAFTLTGLANIGIGDNIIFDLAATGAGHDVTVSYTAAAANDAPELASAIQADINTAGVANAYEVSEAAGVITVVYKGDTDGSSGITLQNFTDSGGNDAQLTVSAKAGSSNAGDGTFTTIGGDTEALTATDVNTATATLQGLGDPAAVTLTEDGNDSSAVAGTITIFMEPGLSIKSSVDGTGTDGGLFNVAADTDVTLGKSIVTLGGQGGFTNFAVGDTISFDVDGTNVSYTVAAGDDTDLEFATGLETALNGAGLGATYSITRSGASVSILETDGTAIAISNFDDDVGGDATLAVSTGTGIGTTPPANALLDASNTSATSTRLFASEGVIQGYSPVISWEKLDAAGAPTGSSGSINVAYPDTVVVEGSLSFDIGAGTLVAGNTFTINTDSTGSADPLSFTPSGKANSILDTYKFTVTSGGEIGTDTVDIKWSNSVTSGTINITGAGDYTIDGMTVNFASGTLLDGDVFTITTNASGTPTSNLPSSWHWTLDSFTDQFNRQTSYVTASKTADNALKFDPTASDNELKNYSYSGSDGFFGSNITITVNNYEALTRTGADFQLKRDDVAYAATGDWGVPAATNPGYAVTLTALDGSDLDNGFYVELDGVRALTVTFDTPITSNGYVEFDIATASGDYSFGFSDDEAEDSGLMAALGINTLLEGRGAGSIGINSQIANKDYIAAAQIDGDTGDFAAGDNANALGIADLQYDSQNIALWTSSRGSAKSSANVTVTLEGYYHSIVGSIGTKSAGISRSQAFSEVMVNQLGEIRDSISAVSLDEEMVNLIKFQHAYTSAAKLISVADEMLNTLLDLI